MSSYHTITWQTRPAIHEDKKRTRQTSQLGSTDHNRQGTAQEDTTKQHIEHPYNTKIYLETVTNQTVQKDHE